MLHTNSWWPHTNRRVYRTRGTRGNPWYSIYFWPPKQQFHLVWANVLTAPPALLHVSAPGARRASWAGTLLEDLYTCVSTSVLFLALARAHEISFSLPEQFSKTPSAVTILKSPQSSGYVHAAPGPVSPRDKVDKLCLLKQRPYQNGPRKSYLQKMKTTLDIKF